MTAELLNALPSRIVSQVLLEGNVSVLNFLLSTFKTPLPSETSARTRAIARVEAPLPVARTYNQALSVLRAWITVALDMGADPEPATLLSSLRSLRSSLIRHDSSFANEVVHLVHLESVASTQTHCSGDNLLTFIALLETELSSRAFSEQSPATTAMRGGRVRRIYPRALP